jgi:hypothetical protein
MIVNAPCAVRMLVAGAIAVASIAAPTASASVARYSAKVVGNGPSGRQAQHQFYVGDGYTGVFRDNRRARTSYRVCLYRGVTRLSCKSGRTGRVGVDDSVFLIAPGQTGAFTYRWLVGGRPVASWTVNIGLGD